MSDPVPRLELEDIQGLIARGYGNLPAAGFLLITIEDRDAAKRWLSGLAESVTPASERPERQAINLAFTASGLAKLGLDPGKTEGFSAEFIAGMVTAHRRRLLGDIGTSAPETWAWGGPATPQVDVLLLLYAADAAELEALRTFQVRALPAGGMRMAASLDTRELDPFEQFGFRDGISQPIIEGLSRTGPWADTLRAGEFVLGYANEYGLFTPRPLVPSAADSSGILPAHPTQKQARDLGRNASYLVLRQLRQYVHRFWQYVDSVTGRGDGSHDPMARTALAAKMVGRWPGGASLALAPEADDPRLAEQNDFGYHRPDPNGNRCPIGSHVRRANPRDSLDPDPGSRASITVNKHHRILRRGRAYGPRIDVEAALGGDDELDEERGLHFVSLNANIARQFEFIQHSWINDPRFNGLYEDPDPLVGGASPPERAFTIQADPVRRRLHGLPEFTSVRGGAYFFLPGLRGIRYLADRGT